MRAHARSAAETASRPHSKTHKSPWVAARQCDHGAVGVCAAKLGEAEVLVAGGISDVLITTELEPSKFARLLNLCGLARISVAADDPQRVSALAKAAEARGVGGPLLVRLDGARV